MSLALAVGIALHCGVLSNPQHSEATSSLVTRWAKDVDPQHPLPDYPRPMMVRKSWTNLNGPWSFDPNANQSGSGPSTIIVPFPPESRLSGYDKMLGNGMAKYQRRFTRPPGEHVLLHFGASDWQTTVFVNGQKVGEHEGGYDPFTFDITSALKETGDQDLVVQIFDPTDGGPQPRGKQVRHPEGIFYTPTSGIWQTVWLEGVPATYLDGLQIQTSRATGQVEVTSDIRGQGIEHRCRLEALDGSRVVATQEVAVQFHENLTEDPGRDAIPTINVVTIPNAVDWSPDNPKLYDLRVSLIEAKTGKVVDQVTSYCAFRDLTLAKDAAGQPQTMLNGKPIFLFGPLDQGFWPDGLYTAPTDEALKFDIEETKKLGFNMIRKHVKVEPQRWYYWCDKLGVLVMQDMPSGDRSIGPDDPDIDRSPESSRIYYRELKAMIDSLRNHPSIICWIPFNEGWGQFETAKVTDWIRSEDPSRLIDSTTGWSDRKVGDFHDIHAYPGPAAPPKETSRASLLGEFGGLGLVTPGHTWKASGWGYQSFKTPEELTEAFEGLLFQLRMLRATAGLTGAVYTQTTDVETELNGLLTYDRDHVKGDFKRLRQAILDVYKAPPTLTDVVPTSEKAAQIWRFTTEHPAEGWELAAFDDGGWSSGPGGFGTEQTPGAIVGTNWDSSDIWVRRSIELPHDASNLAIRVHHDEDFELYVDGHLVAQAKGYTTDYGILPLHGFALKAGRHTLAAHCHQTKGGQFFDLGIVQVR